MSLEFSKSAKASEQRFEEIRQQDLDSLDRELLEAAQAAQRNAYVPYSDFGVGCAARSRGGEIFAGTNMENVSYGVTICAEAAALSRAVTDGDFQLVALAVVGGPLVDTATGGKVVTPCGRCRQLIFEASHVSGEDIRVLCADTNLSRIVAAPISELLPLAFGPRDFDRP